MNNKRKKIPRQGIELLIIAGLSIIVFIIASRFDIMEKIFFFSQKFEKFELDEIITVFIFLSFSLILYTWRRKKEFLNSHAIMEKKNEKLKAALSEIRQLKGIIPICASCKMIRDDQGYWHQVEVYVQEHTDADFSHGLCPECSKKIYPDHYKEKKKT